MLNQNGSLIKILINSSYITLGKANNKDTNALIYKITVSDYWISQILIWMNFLVWGMSQTQS